MTATQTLPVADPHTAALARAAERMAAADRIPSHVAAASAWKAWVVFSSRSRAQGASFGSLLVELGA